MRYVTTMDGDIFGVYYVAGDEVDTTNWTRKLLLEGLAVGVITSTDVSPTALIEMLKTRGKSIKLETTPTTVTIVITPTMSDLADVDLSAGLGEGKTLAYSATKNRWVLNNPRPWPRVDQLANVEALGAPGDGQTIVWSSGVGAFVYGDAGGGGTGSRVYVQSFPPADTTTGTLWYDTSTG